MVDPEFVRGYDRGGFAPNSDIEHAEQIVDGFFGLDSRHHAQNRFMIDRLGGYGLNTDGAAMAVTLHDVVDHGLTYPRDEETRIDTQIKLTDFYNSAQNKPAALFALSCSISKSLIEGEVVERWRDEVLKDPPGESAYERRQIIAAVDPANHKDVTPDEKVLRATGIVGLDTAGILKVMQKFDKKAMALEGVEFIYNFKNPPPDNPASVWRDYNEARIFLSPALSLCEYRELASDVRGTALEYPEYSPAVVKAAKEQFKISSEYASFFEEVLGGSVLDQAIQAVMHSERTAQRIEAGELDAADVENLRQDTAFTYRVKTFGSLADKLSRWKYASANADKTPDGIGYKYTLPDWLENEDIENFAGALKSGLLGTTEFTTKNGVEKSFSVRLEHVLEGEEDEKNLIKKPRPSNYRSYHLAFIADIDGKDVPIEVHGLRRKDEVANTFSKAGHDFHKAGKNPDIADIGYFRQFGERANYEDLEDAINPNMWFELIRLLPDLNTEMHKMYTYVDVGSAKILVPDIQFARFVGRALRDSNLEGNILLPPGELKKDKLFELLKLLDPGLEDDSQINKAVELLESFDILPRRDKVSQRDGHLYPSTFAATYIVAQTHLHLKSGNPTKYLSDTATATLLHDILEEVHSRYKNDALTLKINRKLMKDLLKAEFSPEAVSLVETMTKNDDIVDEVERRDDYGEQLEADPRAVMIKVVERMQNHVYDLIRMRGRTTIPLFNTFNVHRRDINFVKGYFHKTSATLTPIIDRTFMPIDYHQLHEAVMAMGAYLFKDAVDDKV